MAKVVDLTKIEEQERHHIPEIWSGKLLIPFYKATVEAMKRNELYESRSLLSRFFHKLAALLPFTKTCKHIQGEYKKIREELDSYGQSLRPDETPNP